MTYRICTICEIPHYDNCQTCFGFGVHTVLGHDGKYLQYIPVSAEETDTRDLIGNWWMECPECHSTPMGIPVTERDKQDGVH